MGDEGSGIDTMGLCVVALLDAHGVRHEEVVQTGDVPERERQDGGGLAVRRVKSTDFGGVLVRAHLHTEGNLYSRNRTLDLDLHAIAGAAGYRKAVHFSE